MDWNIPDRSKRNRSTIDVRPLSRASDRTQAGSANVSSKTEHTSQNKPKHSESKRDGKAGSIVISRRQLYKFLRIGGIGLTTLLLVFLAWQYLDARQDANKLSDPKTSAEKANQELAKELSSIAVLPSDEAPQVAELTDKEKQKNNPFFKDAQNGDKVLVYQKASKVIIYRPSTKQIVNMASLDAGNDTSTQ